MFLEIKIEDNTTKLSFETVLNKLVSMFGATIKAKQTKFAKSEEFQASFADRIKPKSKTSDEEIPEIIKPHKEPLIYAGDPSNIGKK